jgi:hypothetical protein
MQEDLTFSAPDWYDDDGKFVPGRYVIEFVEKVRYRVHITAATAQELDEKAQSVLWDAEFDVNEDFVEVSERDHDRIERVSSAPAREP